MKSDLKWRLGLIILLLIAAGWSVYPPREKLNLGLDLQGGIHLALEVETDKAVQNEVVRAKDFLEKELNKNKIKYQLLSVNPDHSLTLQLVDPQSESGVMKIVRDNLPNFERKPPPSDNTKLVLGLESKAVQNIKENALQQALRTIRNRVDQFGVREPIIQREGENRIIVELAGISDPERAKELVGKTAELRFQLVRDVAATQEELLQRYGGKIPEGTEILPQAPSSKTGEGKVTRYYLLEKEAKVTGADLKDARTSRDEYNMPAVSFEFGREGSRKFGELTEANIDKQLAIVLDNKVQSAPVIRSRITDKGQITGNFTVEEASDLAIVLRAGALPAPVKILEDRTVGPSLGQDSIRLGIQASLIGAALVVIFMIAYYKLSGLIANIALATNIFLLVGALAGFGATLTLPGIAGIALTIGMAVDANILIFERIREELDLGKTVRSAVENGFSRAFVTIIDANLTTLLSGIILFQFGTGPVKGFAVTLSIGILTTLFTAITVTKVMFDLMLAGRNVKTLSI